MATDSDLNFASSDSLEVWAPIHAWRVLGQLKAEAAIAPLISVFNEMEENEWFREEIQDVFAMIGPASIPELADFLANSSNLFYVRWVSAETLVKICQKYPSTRDACLNVFVKQLEQYPKNSREINGAIICSLLDIEGSEATALMEAAFSAKRVDTSIPGNWIDVQQQLGLLTRAEVAELRHYVDAEQVRSKAMKLRDSTIGFGVGVKTFGKGKKRK
jgi:hypothetical protein